MRWSYLVLIMLINLVLATVAIAKVTCVTEGGLSKQWEFVYGKARCRATSIGYGNPDVQVLPARQCSRSVATLRHYGYSCKQVTKED